MEAEIQSIEEMVKKTIVNVLAIPSEMLTPSLEYQSIIQWDSMGHINLIMALEKVFETKIPQSDVLKLSNVQAILNHFSTNENQPGNSCKKIEINRGLNNVYIDETRISLIDGEQGRLAYRGYDIQTLIAKHSYEAVLFLLLNQSLPDSDQLASFKSELIKHRNLTGEVIQLVQVIAHQSPMNVLRTATSALSESLKALPRKEQILAIIAKAPLILGHRRAYLETQPLPKFINQHSHAEYSLLMLLGETPIADIVRIYEQNMIIQAEHDLNASAFTARVCMSTEADIGSAVSAAMATFAGPLHGGALFEAMNMLEAIDSLDQVKAFIQARLQNHLPIYGFGHRVYRTEDPRAQPLKEAAKILSEKKNNHHWFELLEAVKAEMTEYMAHGMNVNVDFYACVSFVLMGLSKELLVPIFAMNRMAGWGAHILEQQQNNILIRPRLKYVGTRNV